MKKTTKAAATAVASLCAVATMAGCSSGSGGSGPRIAYIQGVAGDEFYTSMECAVNAEAEAQGVRVTTQGPAKFDPTLQKPIVDSVVASSPDAILIAPTDAAAMQAPLEAAKSMGVKVVLVDTTVKDPSVAVSSVSSDNEAGGAAAFDAIKKLAPQGGKVLAVSVDPGVTTTDARVAGFEQAAGADPAFTYLGVQYSHNQPAEAARIITAALAKDPDIVGVFAANIYSAEGSATGVRQAGKQDQVKIVGFDAGPSQVNQLRDGTVAALVAQQPGQIGQDGVQQAMNALNDKPVTPEIKTGFNIITADNVDGEGAQWLYKSSC